LKCGIFEKIFNTIQNNYYDKAKISQITE
jgi:hypothetical protein